MEDARSGVTITNGRPSASVEYALTRPTYSFVIGIRLTTMPRDSINATRCGSGPRPIPQAFRSI
jgi:hypothetical protein